MILPLFKRDLLHHERRRLARETRLFAWTLNILSALMLIATLAGLSTPAEEIFGRGMPYVVLVVLFVVGVSLNGRAIRLKAMVDKTTVSSDPS